MPRTNPKSEPTSLTPSASTANGLEGEVLTLSEAAAYLRLPEAEVMRMVREQNLGARQVGSEWRFLKAAIQDWLRAGTPSLQANKEAWISLVGKYKDDPDLLRICEEAYGRRGRSSTEED